MKFTQIRSATVIVDFGGKRFLIDPMLADKDSYPGFPFSVNSHLFWPRVDLPVPATDCRLLMESRKPGGTCAARQLGGARDFRGETLFERVAR